MFSNNLAINWQLVGIFGEYLAVVNGAKGYQKTKEELVT